MVLELLMRWRGNSVRGDRDNKNQSLRKALQGVKLKAKRTGDAQDIDAIGQDMEGTRDHLEIELATHKIR